MPGVKRHLCECRSVRPIYGHANEKKARWCKHCRPEGTINVVSKRCECNNAVASFGLESEHKVRWCKGCKPIGAINLKNHKIRHTRCECGRAQPSFGLEADKKPHWCRLCKPAGAKNIKNRCECGRAHASFRKPGDTRRQWCSLCKPADAITTAIRCQCGKKRPSLATAHGEKPLWCSDCKPAGAFNVTNPRCICLKSVASFGYRGDVKARWCKRCRPGDAVDIKSLRCVCGASQPHFGNETDMKAQFCKKCKPSTAIELISRRCNCPQRKTLRFGFIGSRPVACTHCRQPKMVLQPTKRCMDCTNLATYGIGKLRLHCEVHRTLDERNLVERPCKSCGLENILDQDDLCEYCSPQNAQKQLHRKEHHVREVLRENGFNDVKFDQIPNGTMCGRERPDAEFELPTHIILLEVDENQHKSYTCECEHIRMFNVSQTYGKPVLWIRYNPDEFKLPNGNKSTIMQRKRETHLLEWIRFAHTYIPKALAEVVYLFYDGCEEMVGPDKILPLLAWDQTDE